jgi:lipoprotein-anchoring transpeptidase ErfK/SrfK
LSSRWPTALLVGLGLGLVAPPARSEAAEADARLRERLARALALPWVEGAGPEATEPISLEVLRQDEPVFVAPEAQAKRRGSLSKEAVFPIFELRSGPGCRGRWLSIGVDAWLCEEHVRVFARHAPTPAATQPLTTTLPHRYWFVGPDGAEGYRAISSADKAAPDVRWEPGFALAAVSSATLAGEAYALTTKGFWVAMRSLEEARPLEIPLHDFVTEPGPLPGWVLTPQARVHRAPGVASKADALARWSKVSVLELKRHAGQSWARIADDSWVRQRDLAIFAPAAEPPGLQANERWIFVDRTNQITTAYLGSEPQFAALVSTGIGSGDQETVTPPGAFRIWVKLRSHDMSNLQDTNASRYFSIEDVPWVMFFHRGYALHGAFWHQSFGRVRSHGCVNLTPAAAARFFLWALPALPNGWRAVLPGPREASTLVVVR